MKLNAALLFQIHKYVMSREQQEKDTPPHPFWWTSGSSAVTDTSSLTDQQSYGYNDQQFLKNRVLLNEIRFFLCVFMHWTQISWKMFISYTRFKCILLFYYNVQCVSSWFKTCGSFRHFLVLLCSIPCLFSAFFSLALIEGWKIVSCHCSATLVKHSCVQLPC